MNCENNLHKLIEDSSNLLNKTIVCKVSYNIKNADYNTYFWEIHISGKGTFTHKNIIKENKFLWCKYRKLWYRLLSNEEITKKMKAEQMEKDIAYYHEKNLTFPYCQPKCKNKGCNETKQNNNIICTNCEYKNKTIGGLKCCGWLSVPCIYDGITSVGSLTCIECANDSYEWVQKGVECCGSGGWFSNDNS